ncbi:MAG: PHP domain-containing protein [Firmicutes bacterium]|nr:PHP domain-containing protein [Bacillota bacterium]
MYYKIETHCHTFESSACGRVPAEQLVELYLEAGYAGLVITDHFSADNSERLAARDGRPTDFAGQCDNLFQGYQAAKDFAQGRLIILMGMELRFNANRNDYLVYGFDKPNLLKHSDLFHWGIERFSAYARKRGLLVVQAHPFRDGMTITAPASIDMLEVHNGHPRQASRNEIAARWAEMHGLPGSSGSDFHRQGDQGGGGVLLPEKPRNSDHFVTMMKEGPLLVKGDN